MIPIKIQCACGQRFAFDVEPVNGRMPSAIACPVCGADGTAAANQVIAQSVGAQPAVAAAPAPAPGLRVANAPPPKAAPPDDGPLLKAPLPTRPAPAGESEGEKWKWWYFVLAGVCIAGYSIWQAYERQSIKPLGELFFAVFCIAIGIWDFQSKRKKRMRG
jgi:hypothetical protein